MRVLPQKRQAPSTSPAASPMNPNVSPLAWLLLTVGVVLVVLLLLGVIHT